MTDLSPLFPRQQVPNLRVSLEQHDSDRREEERAERPEHAGIKPDGEADGRDEQPDHHEGQGEPCGERRRTEAMLGHGRAEHDRQERKHAGRQRRDETRQEGEADARDRHGLRLNGRRRS
jgi:hypothetical protein